MILSKPIRAPAPLWEASSTSVVTLRTPWLEYQLDTQRLEIIKRPPRHMRHGLFPFLMSREDRGLEIAAVEHEPSVRLRLLSLETTPNGDSQWVQGTAFELETLLPDGTFPYPCFSGYEMYPETRVNVLGFAEGTDVIFVGTNGNDTYMIQLNSGKFRKIFYDGRYIYNLIPFTTFCIPVIDGASNDEGQHGVSSARQIKAADLGFSWGLMGLQLLRYHKKVFQCMTDLLNLAGGLECLGNANMRICGGMALKDS